MCSLRCHCGQFQATISDLRPESCNHVVCYCDDCQAFGRWLGTEGMMDARGGTEIIQVFPSQMRVTAGIEHLRLLRLSEKGLLRWYTDCCRSPVGNMLSNPSSPFVGLFRGLFLKEEDAIGPILAKIQGRFAIGGCPPDASPSASAAILWRSFVFLLKGFVGGKYAPSPFFDATTKRPIREARVLRGEERAPLYSR